MRSLIVAFAILTLGACAATPTEGDVAATPAGQCPATSNQSLVGSHVGAVSFAADANVRVVCTTCPTTRDLRPDRMNVRFDQATGIIETVDCG